MPSTIKFLLECSSLNLTGKFKWGTIPPINSSGVYVVSMSESEHENRRTIDKAPISLELVERWINKVRSIELDGMKNPEPIQIVERLSEFWLPDESVIYIGMTGDQLRKRVRQYYNTELGDKRPHAGGHWIKTLSNLTEMFVYVAKCSNPNKKEDILMQTFIDNVSEETRAKLRDSDRPFPFANLEYPKGNIKSHGLGKTKLKA